MHEVGHKFLNICIYIEFEFGSSKSTTLDEGGL